MNIRKWIIPLLIFILASLLFSAAQADEFRLPESLRYIEDEAFSGTAVEEVSLPASVIHVGGNAFAFTDNLKEFRIPKNSFMYSENAILRSGTITRSPRHISKQSLQLNAITGYLPDTGSSDHPDQRIRSKRLTKNEVLHLGQFAHKNRARIYEKSKRNSPPVHPELPPVDWIFP